MSGRGKGGNEDRISVDTNPPGRGIEAMEAMPAPTPEESWQQTIESKQSRTVKFFFNHHRIFTRNEIINAIVKKTPPKTIESVYCLNKPKEYFVCFKNKEESIKFAGETITIDKKIFKSKHFLNKEKDITLHWIPDFVPEEMIVKYLEPTIKVNGIEKDVDQYRFYTGVRKLRVEVEDIKHIPHIHKVGEYPTLITMPGRPPLCLRCGFIGHVSQIVPRPTAAIASDTGTVQRNMYPPMPIH